MEPALLRGGPGAGYGEDQGDDWEERGGADGGGGIEPALGAKMRMRSAELAREWRRGWGLRPFAAVVAAGLGLMGCDAFRSDGNNEVALTTSRTFRVGPEDSKTLFTVERRFLPPEAEDWDDQVSLVRMSFKLSTMQPSPDFGVHDDNIVMGVGSYREGYEGSIERVDNGDSFLGYHRYFPAGKELYGLELRKKETLAPWMSEILLIGVGEPAETMIVCWHRATDDVGLCRLVHEILSNKAFREVTFDYDLLPQWRTIQRRSKEFILPRVRYVAPQVRQTSR